MPQSKSIESLTKHLQEPEAPGIRVGPITFAPDGIPNTFNVHTFELDRRWLGKKTYYVAKAASLSFRAIDPEITLITDKQLCVTAPNDQFEINNNEPTPLLLKGSAGNERFLIGIDSRISFIGTCFEIADFLLMENSITANLQYQASFFNSGNRTIYL